MVKESAPPTPWSNTADSSLQDSEDRTWQVDSHRPYSSSGQGILEVKQNLTLMSACYGGAGKL